MAAAWSPALKGVVVDPLLCAPRRSGFTAHRRCGVSPVAACLVVGSTRGWLVSVFRLWQAVALWIDPFVLAVVAMARRTWD
jgi:hypothetical protein